MPAAQREKYDVRPRRGRPTAARAEAIEQAIFNEAKTQFLTLGFEGAAMEVVAARAGVSKPTLYARYPTKQALLRAVIEAQMETWTTEGLRNQHLLEEDPRERLRHLARTSIAFARTEDASRFTTLVRSIVTTAPELAKTFYDHGYGYGIELYTREIEEWDRRHGPLSHSPRVLAEMLMAMLSGWIRAEETVRTVSVAEAAAFADQAIDALIPAPSPSENRR
jgi:TetR/AcrR family transcriptional regulator, mexJK operon transcriptional repressor